jgi:hypothetical protein
VTSDVAGGVHSGQTERSRPATGPRWLPADRIGWSAAAIGAAGWIWHTVAVLRAYFVQDDFVYLYDAAHSGPTPDYLLRDYNGNVMPGQFLLVWLVNRIDPLNHTLAVLPLLLIAGAVSVLMWSCLVGLCGRRWALLVPFSVFTLSPAVFLTTEWWAYSLELTPLLLAMLAAVRSQITFVRTASLRHAFLAFGWTVAGLVLWDKAVLIPIVVVGLTAALAPRLLRPYWWLWLGYAVLLGAYAGLYLLVTGHDTVAARPSEIPALAGVLVARTFLPGLFGGPWTASGTSWEVSAPPLLALTWAAAAAVIVAGLWLGRSVAVRAFGTLLGYLLADVALVAIGRAGTFGALIGSDPRYTADVVPVALLCGSAALLTRPVRAPRARWAGVLCVCLAASAVITLVGPGYVRTAVARRWVTTAVAAVRDDPDAVLYDGRVPGDVLLSWFGRRATAAEVLGALPRPPTFDQPTGDLRMFDDTGTPRPVTLLGPATGRPGPVPRCGYAVGGAGADIPLTTRARGDRPVVRIGYYTGNGGPGTVDVGRGPVDVWFQPGLHQLFLVADRPPTRVRVTATGDTVCVADVAVGMPLPGR